MHPIGLQELVRLERAEALRLAHADASYKLDAEAPAARARPRQWRRVAEWLDWKAWRRRVLPLSRGV